ncbi:hypothetical protein D7S89_05640 [Trinickia fusca]|uniref:Uncharacterized protein n=1 Tax=Trinickia fusca TaxID=2419777 RepID=A0A494XR06_9BURK|nr:hypothetical protein D7S89_05640 [Trinickia fusca]
MDCSSCVGAAGGCAATIGLRESGAFCITMPLWPSLMPVCVSRMTGLRSESANAGDAMLDSKSHSAAPTAAGNGRNKNEERMESVRK